MIPANNIFAGHKVRVFQGDKSIPLSAWGIKQDKKYPYANKAIPITFKPGEKIVMTFGFLTQGFDFKPGDYTVELTFAYRMATERAGVETLKPVVSERIPIKIVP